MKKSLILGLLILFVPIYSWSATLTVCPSGCDYANLAAVAWGGAGVTAGDTLDGQGNSFNENLTVGASGTDQFNMITITRIDANKIDDGGNDWIRFKRVISSSSADDGFEIDGANNQIFNATVCGAGVDAFDINEDVEIRNSIGWSSTGDDINIAVGKTVTAGYNYFEDAAIAGTGTYTSSSSDFSKADPQFKVECTDLRLGINTPAKSTAGCTK